MININTSPTNDNFDPEPSGFDKQPQDQSDLNERVSNLGERISSSIEAASSSTAKMVHISINLEGETIEATMKISVLAERLGVSQKTIEKMAESGSLNAHLLGHIEARARSEMMHLGKRVKDQSPSNKSAPSKEPLRRMQSLDLAEKKQSFKDSKTVDRLRANMDRDRLQEGFDLKASEDPESHAKAKRAMEDLVQGGKAETIFKQAVAAQLFRAEGSSHAEFFHGDASSRVHLLVGALPGHEENLEIIHFGHSIGYGSYKRVRLIKTAEGIESAAAVARRYPKNPDGLGKHEAALKEIRSENEALLSLHDLAKSRGVQLQYVQEPFEREITVLQPQNQERPIRAFVAHTNYANSVRGAFYDIPLSLQERFNLASQAAIGGHGLDQLGFKDHDIKAENLGFIIEKKAGANAFTSSCERFDLSLIPKERIPNWNTTPIDWKVEGGEDGTDWPATIRNFQKYLDNILGGTMTNQLTPLELLQEIQVAARDASYGIPGAKERYMSLSDKHQRFLEATLSLQILNWEILPYNVMERGEESACNFPTREQYLAGEHGLQIFLEEFESKWAKDYDSVGPLVETLMACFREELARVIVTESDAPDDKLKNTLDAIDEKRSELERVYSTWDLAYENAEIFQGILDGMLETDSDYENLSQDLIEAQKKQEDCSQRKDEITQEISDLTAQLDVKNETELLANACLRVRGGESSWDRECQEHGTILKQCAKAAFQNVMGYKHRFLSCHPKLNCYTGADGSPNQTYDRVKVLTHLGFPVAPRDDLPSKESLQAEGTYLADNPPESLNRLLDHYESGLQLGSDMSYADFTAALPELLEAAVSDLNALDARRKEVQKAYSTIGCTESAIAEIQRLYVASGNASPKAVAYAEKRLDDARNRHVQDLAPFEEAVDSEKNRIQEAVALLQDLQLELERLKALNPETDELQLSSDVKARALTFLRPRNDRFNLIEKREKEIKQAQNTIKSLLPMSAENYKAVPSNFLELKETNPAKHSEWKLVMKHRELENERKRLGEESKECQQTAAVHVNLSKLN